MVISLKSIPVHVIHWITQYGKSTTPHHPLCPAGDPVDHVCERLIDAGIGADDIVVDTGNSLWTHTVERRKIQR